MKIFKKVLLILLFLFFLSILSIFIFCINIYKNANKTVKIIYNPLSRFSKKRKKKVNLNKKDIFSVLLLGIDNGISNRIDNGRSDTMIVVIINPKKKKTFLISLARDVLVEIVGKKTNDKLNHAYAFGGVLMTIDTIEKLLDIPIDSYISINMNGIKKLVDAIDYIVINNKYGNFFLDGVFVPGNISKMDGKTTLSYIRMRHLDITGDIGRQKRQREVLRTIVYKMCSLEGILKYKKILNVIRNNVSTDLSWNNLNSIKSNYIDALKNIETFQLRGKPSSINRIYYQLLDLNDLKNIQISLRKWMEIEY